MIIFVEGCQNIGKTYLIDEFFNRNKNPNIIYYKFKFAKYIDELEMRDQETGPGVHYFSIGNIMTILELNKTLLTDKIVIFDRSIFSAYVWSIYRNRMDKERLFAELKTILSSDLYQNCALVYLTKDSSIETSKRQKDYFENFEDHSTEERIFNEVLDETKLFSTDLTKGNIKVDFVNKFDSDSADDFYNLIHMLTNGNTSR